MLRLIVVFAALASSIAAAAPPQDGPRQLTAERMWAFKRIGDPSITPDGALAVVPVTTIDMKENKGLTDLWLVPVAGGEPRQLTSDKASDTQPTVSPDGKWVAFSTMRQE